MLPNLLNLSSLHDGMMYCPMSIISEGNVWMQLNRPDSAIIDYKKAYGYRLKGKNGTCFRIFVSILLMPICIAVTWRTLLRITGAPCFSVIL